MLEKGINRFPASKVFAAVISVLEREVNHKAQFSHQHCSPVNEIQAPGIWLLCTVACLSDLWQAEELSGDPMKALEGGHLDRCA